MVVKGENDRTGLTWIAALGNELENEMEKKCNRDRQDRNAPLSLTLTPQSTSKLVGEPFWLTAWYVLIRVDTGIMISRLHILRLSSMTADCTPRAYIVGLPVFHILKHTFMRSNDLLHTLF